MSTKEPHWATVRAGNLVVAGGYCWCDEPDGVKHRIGTRPDAND